MKLLKKNAQWQNAKRLMKLLAVTLILNGCSQTVVKTVQVDSFCEGKFKSQWLLKKDRDNLIEIKRNLVWKETIDKLIDNKTLNEKEYDFCPKEKNN